VEVLVRLYYRALQQSRRISKYKGHTVAELLAPVYGITPARQLALESSRQGDSVRQVHPQEGGLSGKSTACARILPA